MIALFRFLLALMMTPFKPMCRLKAANAALRQQLNVLRRRLKSRARLTNTDCWFFVVLYPQFPSILDAVQFIQTETLVRWRGSGFRHYWRLKSRHRVGRPKIGVELRSLIKRMNDDHPLWGAPRIYEEHLKLGFNVALSIVAKYINKRRFRPSAHGWRIFFRNHLPEISGMDLFVVPALGFEVFYALVVIHLDRRLIVWSNVTRHPTAEWVAGQITEAFTWDEASLYLIRDRDSIFGELV